MHQREGEWENATISFLKVRAGEDYLHTAVIHNYIKPLGTLISVHHTNYRAGRVSNCKSLGRSSGSWIKVGGMEAPREVQRWSTRLQCTQKMHLLYSEPQIHKPVRKKADFLGIFHLLRKQTKLKLPILFRMTCSRKKCLQSRNAAAGALLLVLEVALSSPCLLLPRNSLSWASAIHTARPCCMLSSNTSSVLPAGANWNKNTFKNK